LNSKWEKLGGCVAPFHILGHLRVTRSCSSALQYVIKNAPELSVLRSPCGEKRRKYITTEAKGKLKVIGTHKYTYRGENKSMNESGNILNIRATKVRMVILVLILIALMLVSMPR